MRRRLFLIATALAVLLAGCGQDPSGPDTEAPDPPGAPAAPPGPADPADSGGELGGPPRLEKVGDFDRPVYVISPPDDDRLFVVEQEGRVVQVEDGEAKSPPFIDISSRVGCCGERGLLSIAFDPDYAGSGLVYLSYTDNDGDTNIDEFRVDGSNPDRLDPDSRRPVIRVNQPFGNHNGGLITFDPTGMLMIGTGDGGSGGDPANRAQNLSNLLGKFLRIDPGDLEGNGQYGIPEDNPFVDRQGARPEIWAYGLRNPWRFSFDDEGNLYVADVGQNRFEEINFVPPNAQRGANYGWRKYEGNEVFAPLDTIDESRLVTPVVTYRNDARNCSVTGGGLYRGPVSELKGYYLYADFCGGVVKGFKMEGGRAVDEQTFEDLTTSDLSSFGEDSQGNMYVTSLGGEVFLITAG